MSLFKKRSGLKKTAGAMLDIMRTFRTASEAQEKKRQDDYASQRRGRELQKTYRAMRGHLGAAGKSRKGRRVSDVDVGERRSLLGL